MKNILNRFILIMMTTLLVFMLIPKLIAYTPETVNLDIKIMTPDGVTYQSVIPTRLGDLVSVDTTELYEDLEFVYYVFNGNTYSDTHFTFTASHSVSLTAIFKEVDMISITYLDTNNDVLDVNFGAIDDLNIILPKSPSKPGYNFNGWDIPDDITSDIVVHPIYELIDVNLTLTLNGVEQIYPYNEVVELSSTNPNFSYWADEDGYIISVNPNYRFTMLNDRTIHEVSGIDILDEPRLYLSNVTGIREGTISLAGYIESNTLEVIEYGILASKDEKVLNITNATKIPSYALSPTNEYLRTFVGDTYNSFRGYVILSNYQVIYSENNFFIKLTDSFTENFNSTGLTSSYSNITFNGLSDTLWTIAYARNAGDYPINGEGVLLNNAAESYIEIVFNKEILNLSFDYRKAFTGANNRSIEVIVNDQVVYTSSIFGGVSGADATVYNVYLSDIYIPAGSIVKIKLTGTSGTGRMILVDNFKWTEKVEPVISTKLHQVRFNYLGNVKDVYVHSNHIVDIPVLPILETHEFVGWYEDSNFSGEAINLDMPITGHIEVFAKWRRIGASEDEDLYVIDFGRLNVSGYDGSSLNFINGWDNRYYQLNKNRAQIYTWSEHKVLVLSPIKSNNLAYLEFDLTHLNLTNTYISFEYGAWSETALANLRDTDRETYIALEVYLNGEWVSLTNTDGVTNLKETLTEALQTVTYKLQGGQTYRVVVHTPGSGTNSTATHQAAIIDNFKVYRSTYIGSLDPVFMTPDADDFYVELGSVDIELPVLYALDQYGRRLESNFEPNYDINILGVYELIYEAFDSDGRMSSYTINLHVIESLLPDDLPEMDEANLIDIKNSFASNRAGLPDVLNIPYDPLTYYAGLNGLNGEAFKEVLQNILINTHIRPISYDQARFVLEISDAIHTTEGTYIHGIYSNHKIIRYWDGGDTWAREHVWPNPKLGIPRVGGSNRNIGSDLHNLRAINPSVNSSKSNRYFTNSDENTFGTVGTNAYDPGLDHRGDVARIIFYMYVRYETLSLSSIIDDIIAGDAYTLDATTFGVLDLLITWHEADPVDDFELYRNNVIYAYQGNRNPFIDNPDYVGLLFSDVH